MDEEYRFPSGSMKEQRYHDHGTLYGTNLATGLVSSTTFSDASSDTLTGSRAEKALPEVYIGGGATISDYGTGNLKIGRLVGHFDTIEYGRNIAPLFHVENLVYIEDGHGHKHMGYLLGDVMETMDHIYRPDGFTHFHPGCPHHGFDCYVGKQLAAASRKTAR